MPSIATGRPAAGIHTACSARRSCGFVDGVAPDQGWRGDLPQESDDSLCRCCAPDVGQPLQDGGRARVRRVAAVLLMAGTLPGGEAPLGLPER